MPEDLEIDLGNHFAKTALELIFAILEGHSDEPLARKLIGRMARELVVAWDEEPRYAVHRGRRSTKCIRNHELEFLMKEQVTRFVMTLAPAEALAVLAPIIEAVPTMGKEVSEFLELLVSEINSPNAIEVFWTIWQAVADEFIGHIKSTQIESNDPDIRGLLYWLFLHYGWQRAGVDWEPLRGYESRLDDLAEKLPAGVQSLSMYVRYLHNVGARSLPWRFSPLRRNWKRCRRMQSYLEIRCYGSRLSSLGMCTQRRQRSRRFQSFVQQCLRSSTCW